MFGGLEENAKEATCLVHVDVPEMSEENDEVKYIKEKSAQSQANIVGNILKTPEVQHVIRVEINKQMFISGLFMAFFLVGFFQVFNVGKTVFNYNWTVDLIIGLVLIFIGGAYTVKQIRQK